MVIANPGMYHKFSYTGKKDNQDKTDRAFLEGNGLRRIIPTSV